MPEESDVERYARLQIRAAGGRMIKWVSPGRRGTADNLAFWEFPVVDIIEFKRRGGKFDPLQDIFRAGMLELGWHVLLIDTKAKVDRYVQFRRAGLVPDSGSAAHGIILADQSCVEEIAQASPPGQAWRQPRKDGCD